MHAHAPLPPCPQERPLTDARAAGAPLGGPAEAARQTALARPPAPPLPPRTG
jgi:hypothetical protein